MDFGDGNEQTQSRTVIQGVNYQSLEYGQLTHHLQSDQTYKKNFQENMTKSLNQNSDQQFDVNIGKIDQSNAQKAKDPEYRLRVRPDIVLGRLIEGPELQ